MGRSILKGAGRVTWADISDRVKKRRLTEHRRSSLSVSWLWQCDTPPPVPSPYSAAGLPHQEGLDLLRL